MRRTARNSVAVAALLALVALLVAAFGVGSASAITIVQPEAGTCTTDVTVEGVAESPGECTYKSPPSSMYTQAAGHPNFGITDFRVGDTSGENRTKRVHVELPKGLNVNPQAVPQCAVATFQADGCTAASEVGQSYVTSEVEALLVKVPIPSKKFPVYNLVPNNGEPALFGFHVKIEVAGISAISEFV